MQDETLYIASSLEISSKYKLFQTEKNAIDWAKIESKNDNADYLIYSQKNGNPGICLCDICIVQPNGNKIPPYPIMFCG